MALLDVLDQDVFWITDGRRVDLVDMHPAHAANLLAMLSRNADAYYDTCQRTLRERGEPPIYELDPTTWLESTPLWRAVNVLMMLDFESLGNAEDLDTNLDIAIRLLSRFRYRRA